MPVIIEDKALEEVDSFRYLGSIADKLGGSDEDVRIRIGTARASFLQLKNIWRAKQTSKATKLRLFNPNTKSVLLLGAETWRTTQTSDPP